MVDGSLDETKEKGILRRVLGPGTYRINDYAYTVNVVQELTEKSGLQTKHSGWVSVPTGSVGVVTNLAENKQTKAVPGIQDKVLQPGLYPINPKEQHVDIVSVGVTEKSVKSNLVTGPDSKPGRAHADHRHIDGHAGRLLTGAADTAPDPRATAVRRCPARRHPPRDRRPVEAPRPGQRGRQLIPFPATKPPTRTP